MVFVYSIVACFLTLSVATDCDPESGSCDDSTSMKVSMLQKKQFGEQAHEGKIISVLAERKANISVELGHLESQINTFNETTQAEGDLHEELKRERAAKWCNPNLIIRRRSNPHEDGGLCSCRRRQAMSSTGLFECRWNTMHMVEYQCYHWSQEERSRFTNIWGTADHDAEKRVCEQKGHKYKWHGSRSYSGCADQCTCCQRKW